MRNRVVIGHSTDWSKDFTDHFADDLASVIAILFNRTSAMDEYDKIKYITSVLALALAALVADQKALNIKSARRQFGEQFGRIVTTEIAKIRASGGSVINDAIQTDPVSGLKRVV